MLTAKMGIEGFKAWYGMLNDRSFLINGRHCSKGEIEWRAKTRPETGQRAKE